LLLFAGAAGVIYRVRFSPAPVLAHPVAAGEVRGEIMGTGTLEARVKTTISPRLQERLAAVLVDQGETVKTGQLLARLDDAETRQQVAIAEAALVAARATVERVRADEARAQAVLQQAQRDHQRSLELLAGKIASQADFDKTAETLHVAEANLKSAQAAITEAQSQGFTAEKTLLYQKEHLAFTEMRSPFDGLVTRRDRDAGGLVVPGASILQLVATNEIWVTAWVDETALSGLRVGQPARVRFRAEPAQEYAGEVARLGRETDRETREFIVEVRVQALPPNWTIGQRAEVFIETGRQPHALVLPAQFVRWRDQRPGVFVEVQGRARWRDLVLGLRGPQGLEVKAGLAAGDHVVRPLDGQKQPLTEGQRVAAP
jgi:HlyD family secretion protein